eukprot:jgi/Bigna1/74609/fgenesh1_pg.30_\
MAARGAQWRSRRSLLLLLTAVALAFLASIRTATSYDQGILTLGGDWEKDVKYRASSEYGGYNVLRNIFKSRDKGRVPAKFRKSKKERQKDHRRKIVQILQRARAKGRSEKELKIMENQLLGLQKSKTLPKGLLWPILGFAYAGVVIYARLFL